MLVFKKKEKEETVKSYYKFEGVRIKDIIDSCELVDSEKSKWHDGKLETYIGILDGHSIIVYKNEHYEDESRHGSSHYCYSHTSYTLFYMGEKYVANNDTDYFYKDFQGYHISELVKWVLFNSKVIG